MKREGPASADDLDAAARRAAAGCWSSSAATAKEEADAKARRAHGRARAQGATRRRMKLFDDPDAGEARLEGARVGPRRHRLRPRRAATPGRAGRTRPSRPRRSGDYLRDLRTLLDKYGYDARALRPLRPGLHPHAASTSTSRPADGHRKYRALPRRGRRPGRALRRLALRRARRRPGARRAPAARCSAPSSIQAFREFKAIWDPDWKMNPGQGRRPVPHRREPAPRRRLPARGSRRRTSSSPTTTAASRTRRCAASASASAAAHEGGDHVPELHGDARGEALDARPRAPALRDAAAARSSTDGWQQRRGARRRSTSASRARAARATARSTSTWRPTRPSSSSHYYEGRLRPRSAYAMGLIHWWARARRAHAAARQLRALHAPGLQRSRSRLAGGIASATAAFPRFAPQTFRALVRTSRRPRPPSRGASILWPDTFNNYFHPRHRAGRGRGAGARRLRGQAARSQPLLRPAALRLRHARPGRAVCCGRSCATLGPADRRRHPGRRARAELRRGLPRRADRTCSRTTSARGGLPRPDVPPQRVPGPARDVPLPALQRQALVHGHCHHQAVIEPDAERDAAQAHRPRGQRPRLRLLRHGRLVRLRARRTTTSSMKIGERVLLPAVRDASPAHADRRRRLQLPRADRAGDRPPGAAPRPGAPDGAARARGGRERALSRAASARSRGAARLNPGQGGG